MSKDEASELAQEEVAVGRGRGLSDRPPERLADAEGHEERGAGRGGGRRERRRSREMRLRRSQKSRWPGPGPASSPCLSSSDLTLIHKLIYSLKSQLT